MKNDEKRGGVRERVLAHVKGVLSTTAISGAALGLEACNPPVVCDPLPPPLTCTVDGGAQSLSQWVSWHATWTQNAGAWAVKVSLNLETYGADAGKLSWAAGAPALTDATLVREEARDAQTLRLVIQPTPGVATAEVAVALDCNGIAETVRLRLNLGSTKTEAGPVTVTPVN